MKSASENNIDQIFLNKILEYCVDSNPDIEKDKLIESSLSVVSSLPGYLGISFFLFDPDTSQFTYRLSYGNNTKEESEIYFQKYVEEGFVSISLSEGYYLAETEKINLYMLVLPLVSLSGIDGLFLIATSSNTYNDETKKLIKGFCHHFAIKLSNFSLLEELNSLKDNYIDKVNNYAEEISQSSRNQKKILDAIQVGIILIDKNNGEIVDVNITAANMIGAQKEALIGTERNNLFIFSDFKKHSNKVLHSTEEFLRKKDGTIIQVLCSMQEMEINDELFIAESFIDITDRKQMETDLQKANDELETRVAERTKKLVVTNIELQKQIKEKIRTEEERRKLYYAVQQSPAVIYITDLDGNIQYVNPVFTQITGYSSEEVLGRNPRFLKSGDVPTSEYNMMWRKIINGEYWSGEFRNKKKNGELFWVSSFVSPIKNSNGEIINYLAIQQDISERKLFEQNLIEAKDKAEQSDKLKSNLLANMSHEFRTPMIGIIGFTQMLQEEIADEEQLYLLEQLSQCNDRLMATINNIMNMSQLQSGEIQLTNEKINVNTLLKKITTKLQPNAKHKNLQLDFVAENEEIEINFDKALCELIFTNVIDNAIKYTQQGSVNVRSCIIKGSENSLAEVEVKDTGIGIPDNGKEKIFNPFIQLSTGYSRAQDGMGLGLAVSKKIIELVNGEIIVENNTPNGTIFKIRIPI